MTGKDHEAERSAPRHEAKMAAEVIAAGKTVHAHTRDISTGGVGLVLRAPLDESASVELVLFLTKDGIEDADHEPLHIHGRVQWTAEQDDGSPIAGIKFDPPTRAQEARLTRFMSDLS